METPLNNMLDAYAEFVQRGAMMPNGDTERERLLLCCAGLGGEGGEVIDLIKKECFHGNPIPRQEYVLELGDVFWYFILTLRTKGISLDEVIRENMVKLVNRYPDKHPELRGLLLDVEA